MGITPDPSDPFIEFMHPPPNESPAEAMSWQKRELDAQKRSDAIDESIKQARDIARQEKGIVKVLLLGQSGSGKSTLLKNLRMRYAKEDWEKERDGWRAAILLTIVRSITTILSVIEANLTSEVPAETENLKAVQVATTKNMKFTDHHRLLMLRLAPLRGVEAELQRRLDAGSELGQAVPSQSGTDQENLLLTGREFAVRPWKNVSNSADRHRYMEDMRKLDLNSVTDLIVGCKDDMKALLDDKVVPLALREHKFQLPDTTKFFLDDLDRIASRDYVVTDDDIVRARLRTVGIQEHRIKVKYNNAKDQDASPLEWRIFEVGGYRSSRAAWLPFFDNVNSLVFLSPVSVFDQRLEEDTCVNRLEDSIKLWTSICRSRLLAKAQLILFLNKCDLLKQKLKRGIKVKEYIPSYGDRPNEVAPFVKYLREKFTDILKRSSPGSRHVSIYAVIAINMSVVTTVVAAVREGVLRENIAASTMV